MNDLVSIITPLYNSEKYISETIESIFSQTYTNWELIVVDDCSTDSSLSIVQNYDDPKVRIFKNEVNSGVVATRNKALSHAKGRFIAFLDSDDLWLSSKLEKQIDFMKKNDHAFSFHSYYKMTENGVVGDIVKAKSSVDYSTMLKSNFIGCLTSMYDSQKVGKVPMIPGYKAREDYICWLEILKKAGPAHSLNEPLAKYRVLTTSLSSKKTEMLKEQYRVYKEVLKMNPLQISYYFLNYLLIGWKKYRT